MRIGPISPPLRDGRAAGWQGGVSDSPEEVPMIRPMPRQPEWEDTMPMFSVRDAGKKITAPPLDTPGVFGFAATISFVLWVVAAAAGALFFHRASGGDVIKWQATLLVVYLFVPAMFTGLTADEAEIRVGQRATAHRIAAIPAVAGVAVGLLVAAVWIGGPVGGLVALTGTACSIGAAIVILVTWRGLRTIRARHVWTARLRAEGTRTPGSLREVRFLKRWDSGRPRFTAVVDYPTHAGPQQVSVHMTTTPERVPRPGTAVAVTWLPHDPTAEPLIELAGDTADFDPDPDRYREPSAN